jgi:hypothetical protein
MISVEPGNCDALSSYGKRDDNDVPLPSSVTLRMRTAYVGFWNYLASLSADALETAYNIYGENVVDPRGTWMLGKSGLINEKATPHKD